MDNHNVDTFLSMSGPQMGQYGVIGGMEKFYPNITDEIAWTLLYNLVAQHSFSAAAYWNGKFYIFYLFIFFFYFFFIFLLIFSYFFTFFSYLLK